MSNARTNYATISTVDYRGEHVLSSYNLPITPLTFFANVPTQTDDSSLSLNNTEVTFDYGDGTIDQATSIYTISGSNILSAGHSFKLPGLYTVRMVLRDCNNNAILASQSKDIEIEDYVTNTFTVTCLELDTGYKLNLSAGEYSTPLTINAQSPFYQDFQDIYFSVSGTDCPNYFNLDNNKHKHLYEYFSFYDRQFLPNLTGFEYAEITKVALSSENLYVRLSGEELVTSSTKSTSSVLAGTSGTQVVYFKTVKQDTPVYLNFYKDRKNIYSRGISEFSNHNFLNNFTVSLSSAVGTTDIQNPSAGRISITSNGLDNEGEEINSFELSPIQYKNTNIPFILKPKNENQFTMKSLSAGDPEFVLICNGSFLMPGANLGCLPGSIISTEYYSISNLNNTLSSIGTDFWYRGALNFNDSLYSTTSAIVMNVQLSARNFYLDTETSVEHDLSGSSSFSLYPKDYYSLYKVNEDFDFEGMIKDLRFQEVLLDDNIFFTDFIGSIFGGVSSTNGALGKTLYESIINFVQNTSDVDVCNITALEGLSKLVDNETLIYHSNHPPEIKRLINLFSVQYNKFRGYQNQFSQNFDPKNRTTREVYGSNLGDEISFLTHIMSGGKDIVAYEKFSGEYTQLNSYQPLSLSGTLSAVQTILPPVGIGGFGQVTPQVVTYSLSTYNNNWGWPLVLPESLFTSQTALDGTDIPYGPDPPGLSGIPTLTNLSALSAKIGDFYTFYQYICGGSNTITNGIIDWNNPQTGIMDTPYTTGAVGEPTHSYGAKELTFNTGISGLEGDNNIFDIMIRDSLFSSLSLFEG
tara:strand:+ start:4241 stop:6661 length:2421 start_codon:yes stop_codon:yes gene_type:complete